MWSFSRDSGHENTPTVKATSVTKHFRSDMTTATEPPLNSKKNHLILTPGYLHQTLQLLSSVEVGSWAAQLRERRRTLGNRNTRLQFPEHSLDLNSEIQPRLLCQRREREGGRGRALSELMTYNLLAENRRGLLKLLNIWVISKITFGIFCTLNKLQASHKHRYKQVITTICVLRQTALTSKLLICNFLLSRGLCSIFCFLFVLLMFY